MQSYADLEREYLRRKATYDDRCLAIARRLDDLQQRSWERVGPADVLNHALPQEIAGMRSITKCEESAIVNAIIDAIRKAGSNTTASAGRKLMGRDPYVSYREVLDDAAKKLKVEGITANSSDSAVETALTATAFKAAWEKATPIEREALAKHLSASDRKTLYTMGATGTALAGAGAVGFPLYIAASTVVGSLTSAIGVTLPFAAYTTMSSGIALVIGPAGWLALIGVAAWKIGGVNYAVTIPAVTAIAAVRGRLIAERDQEIAGLEAERQGELQVIGGQLATLKTLLDRMRVEGLRSVPRESISL
ncbi:MAG: hypothetical protein ACRESR_07665 [Gammaproteobacteria bacterium]